MRRQVVVVAAVAASTLLGPSADAAIRIKKIAFDPAGKDRATNRRLDKEWVLIKNTGEESKALDHWVVRDRGGEHRFRFPSYAGEEIRWVLPAGDLLKLHSGRGRPRATDGCGGDCKVYHYYWRLDEYVWGNGGDRATLKNARKKTVDRCAYDASDDSPTAC
jgi:hypothetical protein